MFKVIRNHTVTDIIFFLLPKVKNATSYFKNGLKNRFRAIAIRADEHSPLNSPKLTTNQLETILYTFKEYNFKLKQKVGKTNPR